MGTGEPTYLWGLARGSSRRCERSLLSHPHPASLFLYRFLSARVQGGDPSGAYSGARPQLGSESCSSINLLVCGWLRSIICVGSGEGDLYVLRPREKCPQFVLLLPIFVSVFGGSRCLVGWVGGGGGQVRFLHFFCILYFFVFIRTDTMNFLRSVTVQYLLQLPYLK